MKQIKQFALALAVAAASVGVSGNSYAFMMQADENTVSLVDMTQTVDGLRQEFKAGETSCEALLAKIDEAIASIDGALERGVADEKKYLGLRDELVELRLELPCLGNELTQEPAPVVTEPVFEEPVLGSEVVGAPMPAGGALGAPAGGGFGGGAGGAGLGGGLGIGPLALGGIAAAIAIPVAVAANDDPGANASPN